MPKILAASILAIYDAEGKTMSVTGRDLLHRLVDDLDEDDAELLASAAADPSASARLLTAVQVKALKWAAESGSRSEQVQIALRKMFEGLKEDPDRSALYTIIFVASTQDFRREMASALSSLRRDPASAVPAAAQREWAVADAVGSVRAEGLEPSAAALRDFAEYEAGRMTADDLYEAALRRAHSMTQR